MKYHFNQFEGLILIVSEVSKVIRANGFPKHETIWLKRIGPNKKKTVLSWPSMSNNDLASGPQKPEIDALDAKIESWEGWDDSEWKINWMKVYGSTVGFSVGGSLIGAGHAVMSGRSVIPNSLLFAGYGALVSGLYYSTREILFGREIERFRREALALDLPESVARDYPAHWDLVCGAMSGTLTGSLLGQSRNMVIASALIFGVSALALRKGSAAFSAYAVPILLPAEKIELERKRRRQIMSDSELQVLEERENTAAKNRKLWIFENVPDWFPIQMQTESEHEQMEKDKAYDQWLEKEVETTRVKVAVKRRLKQLEEAELNAARSVLSENNNEKSTSTSPSTVLKANNSSL